MIKALTFLTSLLALCCHPSFLFAKNNSGAVYVDECNTKVNCNEGFHLVDITLDTQNDTETENDTDVTTACIKPVLDLQLDFLEAATKCHESNSSLLQIKSFELNTYVKELLNDSLSSIWILVDPVWNNNSNEFSDWGIGQPEVIASIHHYQCGVIEEFGWRLVDCSEKHAAICAIDIEGLYPKEENDARQTQIVYKSNQSEVLGPGDILEATCHTKDFVPDASLSFWFIKWSRPSYFGKLMKHIDPVYISTETKDTGHPCNKETFTTVAFQLSTWMKGWQIACFRDKYPSPLDFRYCDDVLGDHHCGISPPLVLDLKASAPEMTATFSRKPNVIFEGWPFSMTWTATFGLVPFTHDSFICEFTHNPIPESDYTTESVFNEMTTQALRSYDISSMEQSYSNTRLRCYIKVGLHHELQHCDRSTYCAERTIRVLRGPDPPDMYVVYDQRPSTKLEGSSLNVTCQAFVGEEGNLTWVVAKNNFTISPNNYTRNRFGINYEMAENSSMTIISTLKIPNITVEDEGLVFMCFSYVSEDALLDNLTACPPSDGFCVESLTLRVKEKDEVRLKGHIYIAVLVTLLSVTGLLLLSICYVIISNRRRKKERELFAINGGEAYVDEGTKVIVRLSRKSMLRRQSTAAGSGKAATDVTDYSSSLGTKSYVYEEIDRDGNVSLVAETVL